MKLKLDGRRRVTIPTLFAEELGLKENSIIDIELIDKKIIISNSNEFNLNDYIKSLLNEDVSFETEKYLKDILNKIKNIKC